MKNVLIVVRESPFNRLAPTEALRLAPGLTLKENHVRLADRFAVEAAHAEPGSAILLI